MLKIEALERAIKDCGGIIAMMSTANMVFAGEDRTDLTEECSAWIAAFIYSIGDLNLRIHIAKQNPGYLQEHHEEVETVINKLVGMREESEHLVHLVESIMREKMNREQATN